MLSAVSFSASCFAAMGHKIQGVTILRAYTCLCLPACMAALFRRLRLAANARRRIMRSYSH